ncbi:unnamed protein product [Schistosoma margrebowiei]|uniref:Uncharacterized protein n=1 Tax=Schistosoma margrebowiei TaxID=48269 RepID=A0A183LVY4_9TREM|nr:unnamed protein product [Schistosoma margrebowiei]
MWMYFAIRGLELSTRLHWLVFQHFLWRILHVSDELQSRQHESGLLGTRSANASAQPPIHLFLSPGYNSCYSSFPIS